MLTIEEAIEHAEDIAISAVGCECREEHKQLAEWLRELQERRKAPEIVRCGECGLYYLVPTGRHRCSLHCTYTKPDDFCSLAEKAERRTDGEKQSD